MEDKQEKYYAKSDGTIVKMKDLHTENIINSIAKKQREIFNSKTKDEYNEQLNIIVDLYEELYIRFSRFESDKFGDSDGTRKI